MQTLRQDIHYALRILARRPGFTIVAVLTLAVGIAANATIFSLIDGVLLRSLPFPDSARLLNLWATYTASDGTPDIFAPGLYLEVAKRSTTLESAAGYTDANFALSGDGQPEQITGIRATASIANVLGVAPQLGRWFTSEEDEAGENVAVLSDSLWKSRFGGDTAIVGRKIDLNGRACSVVGVLPPGVGFPSNSRQIYAPISFTPAQRASGSNIFLTVIARQRRGVALSAVNAELKALAAALSPSVATNDPDAISAMGGTSLQDSLVGNFREMLIVLWAAVAFMLAVGCANVANLLMAHAAGRQKEFALRRSIGASNGRIVRQLLTESLSLGITGGIAGLVLAGFALPAIIAFLPRAFPRFREIDLDAQTLWYTMGVSLLTGLLFGLAPALGAARSELASALRESERGQNRRVRGLGRTLVVAEVAAVMVLLVGAGLVLRSLFVLSRTTPGFEPRGVVAWQMILPQVRYDNVDKQRAFYRAVLDQAQQIAGVERAAFAQPLPFGPVDIVSDTGFRVAGQTDAANGQIPQALITRVTPSYFSTMGIPVERGRVFAEQDGAAAGKVVISHSLAARYFGSQDPIGRQLLLGSRRLPVEIVGVVGDVKHINLQASVRPEFYLPLWSFTPGAAGLVVKARGPASATLDQLRQRVWSVDRAMPGNLAASLNEILYNSMAPARIAAVLLGGFAAVTLFLGLVGVYGVLSYAVRQRRKEIGIRLAMGASRVDVLGMVIKEALNLSAAGVVLGAIAGVLLSRFLETLLFGVERADPATYLIVAITVPLTASLAAYLPARRASAIDPAECLRAD